MLRFVDLGHQLGLDETWPQQFSLFTTVSDRFLEFGGKEVWHSWNDFVQSWNHADDSDQDTFPLSRIRPLCAPWVFQVKGNPFASS